MLNLSPLCGGLPPRLAWPYLKHIGEVVMPEVAAAKGATSAGGLGDTLTSLLPHARCEWPIRARILASKSCRRYPTRYGLRPIRASTTSANWSDDVDADVAKLEANGMVLEVKSLLLEGTTLWAYCKGATGPRIELVSRAMEPFLARWFATADGGS